MSMAKSPSPKVCQFSSSVLRDPHGLHVILPGRASPSIYATISIFLSALENLQDAPLAGRSKQMIVKSHTHFHSIRVAVAVINQEDLLSQACKL